MTAFLRKLFFIHKLYGRKSGVAIALDYALLAAALTVASSVAGDYFLYALAFAWIIWLYLLLRSIAKSIIIKRRFKSLRRLAFLSAPNVPTLINMSALNDEFEDKVIRQYSISNQQVGEHVYDAEINFYRETKHGQYLSKQLYYSVFEVKLNRQLPNIIFDSKRSKGHQFRYVYLQSQRLSLEGDFDKSFRVYTPDYYEVDMLSFITPEIMLVFKEVHDYDIELVGDRLFLYGPLLLESKDHDRMVLAGRRLAVELNENIVAYADSYIIGAGKRTGTTQFARQLLRSPFKPALSFAACLAVIGGVVVYCLWHDYELGDIMLTDGAFYLYAFTGLFAVKTFKIMRDNKKAVETFELQRRMKTVGRPPRPSLIDRTRL